jgi:hypothetical protein
VLVKPRTQKTARAAQWWSLVLRLYSWASDGLGNRLYHTASSSCCGLDGVASQCAVSSNDAEHWRCVCLAEPG